MPYTRTVWVDGQPPAISAAQLNKIEAQLEAVTVLVEALAGVSGLRVQSGRATTDAAVNTGSTTSVEGWSATFAEPFSAPPTVVATANDSRITVSVSTPTEDGASGFARGLGVGSASDLEDVFWIAIGPA